MASSQKDEKRKAAAERAKKYREKKLAKEDPEAAAKAEAEKKAAQEAEQKAAEEAGKQTEERKKEIEEQLVCALAGTLEVLTSAIAPKGAPSIGQERAQSVGKLWAPLLAPYLESVGGKWLPWFVASAGTVGIGAAWMEEVKEWKQREAEKQGGEKEDAT